MSLVAGVGRADVTPPVGIMMSGYASRKTPAVGIHDDLAATVLYLSDGEREAAIVALDLIQMRADEVAAVRQCCQQLAGLPGANVFISCSHTHGGPVIGPGEKEGLQQSYAETVRWQIAGALCEARNQAVAVRLGRTCKQVLVAGNRRERTPSGTILGYNPEAPTPRYTDVLRFDDAASGAPLVVLCQYACHGTTMGGDNYLLTADYQGYARRFVESQLPGTRAMYIGGCGGNQNPYPRGTFDLAQRHGHKLGAAAYQGALEITEAKPVGCLTVLSRNAALPLAPLPPVAECRRQQEEAEAAAEAERARAEETARQAGQPFDPDNALSWATQRALESARERLAAAERGETDLSVPVELQVVALDDVALVSLPGEVFFEIGEEIRHRSPFGLALPVAYANGAIGYIPTAAEVPYGGYEVEHARARRHGLTLADEADSVLIEEALAALAAVS